jgi:hypothetical protein
MKKKIYIQPSLEEIKLNAKSMIMASSTPGIDPTSSFGDESIVGSRQFRGFWDEN